jgi:acyl dehydratase
MTEMTAEQWQVEVDRYVSGLQAMAGRSSPAPLFPGGPYAFSMLRTSVNADLISQFIRSNGDRNPLWTDPGYAASTPWGSPIAPPIFEACLAESVSMPPPPTVPGWNEMQGGAHRRYHAPLRSGDMVHAVDTWRGVDDKSRPGRPYRLFIKRAERDYIKQDGTVAVTLSSRIACLGTVPGSGHTSTGPDLSDRRRRRYTDEELAAVRRDYERELSGEGRRGAQPRLWEDVNEGDELAPMLKGPYDISDAVAFAGVLGICTGFASKWEELAPVLDLLVADPDTGAPHHPIDWHFQDSLAQLRGLPYAQAFGTHMEMMLVHPVTNWMSDHAFVVETDCRLTSVLLLGEISRVTGHVTGKLEEDGYRLVEIELQGQTIDGVTYGEARVRIALPSRNGKAPSDVLTH